MDISEEDKYIAIYRWYFMENFGSSRGFAGTGAPEVLTQNLLFLCKE